MNTAPTNSYTAPDANYPPLPFTPRQLETQDNQAPTFIFSNDTFDSGYFNDDVPAPRAPPHGTLPRHANPIVRRRRLINIRRRGHARPGAISPSRTASFGAPPQANILAGVAPQLTTDPHDGAYALNSHPPSSPPEGPMFDSGNPLKLADWRGTSGMSTPGPTWHRGTPQPNTHMAVAPQLTMGVFGGTSDPITYPSASRPSGSSSAAFDGGKELSYSGIQNIPIPMTSGLVPVMAPALASSSPLTWMSSMTPTPKPFVRPWDAGASSMGTAAIAAATSTTYGSAEPRQAPISHCSCYKRAHPFVRVDDTIEWVRPDVMKMVLYFNWSANAEAEAHESWEPRGA